MYIFSLQLWPCSLFMKFISFEKWSALSFTLRELCPRTRNSCPSCYPTFRVRFPTLSGLQLTIAVSDSTSLRQLSCSRKFWTRKNGDNLVSFPVPALNRSLSPNCLVQPRQLNETSFYQKNRCRRRNVWNAFAKMSRTTEKGFWSGDARRWTDISKKYIRLIKGLL